mgnify:CR=1 FL=1
MRILFLGDVVGISGRSMVLNNLLSKIKDHKIDFVIVNGENAADAGVGLTEEICKDFFNCGVDVITTGNHVWDQKETMSHIEKENRLLRPKNLFEPSPGKGFEIFNSKNGMRVGVLNLMGNVFMKKCDDVFQVAEKFIKKYKEKSVNQLKFYNSFETFEERKKYIMGFWTTFDNYSLSIMYLKFIHFINTTGYTDNKFIIHFTELLLKNIDPNPENRLDISDTIQKFNGFLTQDIHVGIKVFKNLKKNFIDDKKDIDKVLKKELEKYNPELLYKERILAITKSDLIDDELKKMLLKEFKKQTKEDIEMLFISSVTNKNLDILKDKLWHIIN